MQFPNLGAAGILAIGNVLTFAFVWGLIGAWLVPWATMFFHAPSVAGLLWVLGW